MDSIFLLTFWSKTVTWIARLHLPHARPMLYISLLVAKQREVLDSREAKLWDVPFHQFFMLIFGWAKLKSITISVNVDTRWRFPFSDIQKLTHNAHKQKTMCFRLFKMKVLLTSRRATLQLYLHCSHPILRCVKIQNKAAVWDTFKHSSLRH